MQDDEVECGQDQVLARRRRRAKQTRCALPGMGGSTSW